MSEREYLSHRAHVVTSRFPGALGLDDFMQRVEIALYAFGFEGGNSIAMVNLCRDEVTVSLKHAIDHVFGSSFNTNGLGGVLTCGVTGVRAGLSHAPVSESTGRERYVFFSFPHISIDARGTEGAISRPGRPGQSHACGALLAALGDIRRGGLAAECKVPGVHEPLDPEFTILKQRLARRLKYEGADEEAIAGLTLTDVTSLAERTITDDLEHLIDLTVDPEAADYAVITGVQIHSWGSRYDDAAPNLELVAPCSAYCVTGGVRTDIDLQAIPCLTPRQTRVLAQEAPLAGGGLGGLGSAASGAAGAGGDAGGAPSTPGSHPPTCNSARHTTLRETRAPYQYATQAAWRARHRQLASYARLLEEEARDEAVGVGGGTHAGATPPPARPTRHEEAACPWPSWQSRLRAPTRHRKQGDSSIVIDHPSFRAP